MIVKIKDNSQQTILVGSKVTFDPSVLTPAGPFNVLTIDEPNKQFTCDGAGLEGTNLTADGLADVDNSAVPQQVIDFGNGVQALLFPDAALLVTDLIATEASMAQQIKDLQSGAAIQQLLQQVKDLQTSNIALKNQVTAAVQLWPVGVGDTMNQVQTILTAPPK